MQKEKILIAFDTVTEGFEELEQHFELVRPPKGRDFTQEEIMHHLPECVALGAVFDIPIQKEIIDAGTSLRLIANYAVGYNNIDVAYAQSKGIAVANTPKSVVVPTAELALALMLSASRRVAEWDRTLRHKGRTFKPSRLEMLGIDLWGKRVGIIGLGNIGKAVARRCQAFGMQVLYYSRHRLSTEVEKELEVTYTPLDTLFQEADILSLNMPYNKDSHHVVNKERLRSMKSTALLINTARGAVVDEEALVIALQEGWIAGAGLDVFEDADRPDERLLSMENVVMTPHVGTQTYDARVSMAREMSDNILGFFLQDRAVSLVSV